MLFFSHMLRGTNGSPQRIKQGLTDEEAPKLAEHLDRLPNINIQRDSVREYVYGDTLKNIYGRVGSIQTESVDDYLARGYMRSDLVGNSFFWKNSMRMYYVAKKRKSFERIPVKAVAQWNSLLKKHQEAEAMTLC